MTAILSLKGKSPNILRTKAAQKGDQSEVRTCQLDRRKREGLHGHGTCTGIPSRSDKRLLLRMFVLVGVGMETLSCNSAGLVGPGFESRHETEKKPRKNREQAFEHRAR